MLQRAASNAYSWWYASHVRTKQSKWLEQSLQDMGEKVEAVLQLIQEDGDSFAKRAEMYYKKRPELINFVEESYRAYRSLAERYDHISRELQNANNTLASAFPDQYQFMMDDDDDYNAPGVRKKIQDKPSNNQNIPQAPPKFPSKNIKAIIALTTNSKKPPPKTGPKSGSHANKVAKSGLTMSEAASEIDKLQKQILTLQTEKEFAKSSYESGYAKYCDIDEQISGAQEKISKLQDEFEVAQVIEDDEARNLMAEAAIKSCNNTLSQLQEKQERASKEAKAESHKIKNVRDKLNSFKGEFRGQQTNTSEDQISIDEGGIVGLEKSSKDLELLQDKIKEHFDVGETKSLSVLEMAEKIDELVNKVINLEFSMSSQTALIHSLRSETDELQSQVKSLENDKANLIAGKTTLNDKLGEMENKLRGLQDLNESLENQNSSLETHFKEANSNFGIMSTKWFDVNQEKEVEDPTKSKESKGSIANMDVKVGILQDEQVNNTITSSLTQDEGEKVQKTALQMSTNDPPIPSQTDNIEQHESKPSTIDNIQPQKTSNKKQEQVISTQTTHKQASTPPEVDVKVRVVQDEPITDIITSSLNQDDGERFQKIALLIKADELPIPSNKNNIQNESKPTTIDNNQPQETSNKKEEEVINPQATDKQHPTIQASTPPQVDVKVSIVQDEQVSDMVASSLTQDEGEMLQKIDLPMSTDEPPIPSKTDSTQQQESKPSTHDNQLQETSEKKEEKVISPQANHKQHPTTLESSPLEVELRELTNKSLDKLHVPLLVPTLEERRKEEPDWKQLFTDGLEGKEKVLLAEYTTTLRNYKETKKKLYEVETKNEENFSEIEKQLKELKNSLATKDGEIQSLRQKLIVVQKKLEEYENAKGENMEYAATYGELLFPPEDDDDIKVMVPGEEHEISAVEHKLRAEMDQILEENLDFWMRFSASFGQVQKFQNGVQDLQAELANLEKNSEKKEGSSHGDTHVNLSLKSDVRPIYKHLIEIQTELTVWLEQSEKLKEELQRRFSQLCHIQEEIKHALNAGAEDDDMKFTSFQAAKFQGEVANMQQENNKVADELQASMDYITSLQLEVERTTTRLNEELGFSNSKSQNERYGNRARVPLRSFIFGVKPQKKKQSIFSCMHPGMTNRKYHQLKGDKSP